jgi:putative hydrolase of HD superfamily
MTARAEKIVETMLGLTPLSELPRTGWLLRGVRPCESIAEHSFGVAAVAMLLVDALRAEGEAVDGERVLRMALVHDVPEACTGDVPMPQKTPKLLEGLRELEESLAARLLPPEEARLWSEADDGRTLEARVVKAADKLQMMLEALVYERAHRGDVTELWDNPKNFNDRGLEVAREIFAELRARSGRT